MADDPKTYRAVTVSSTFTDLQTHRREVNDALVSFDLFPKVIEFDGARADADVIDSSLGFVRDSSAFIGIISHKYGQTPACPNRNPECLSIFELEFNKAMELGHPILLLFCFASESGDAQRADRLWAELDPMGREWDRLFYRPGTAEILRAFDRWRRGDLAENQLAEAETLAHNGRNRDGVRQLAYLRGRYHLERGEAGQAVESLAQAVRMAREVRLVDAKAEACHALARLRAGEAFDAHAEAERLDRAPDKAQLDVAELWQELGEPERAIAAARRARDWAVADGEPYVFRYELKRTRALLEELGTDLPEVPQYDPAADPPFDWEADVRKLIEELKAKRANDDEAE